MNISVGLLSTLNGLQVDENPIMYPNFLIWALYLTLIGFNTMYLEIGKEIIGAWFLNCR